MTAVVRTLFDRVGYDLVQARTQATGSQQGPLVGLAAAEAPRPRADPPGLREVSRSRLWLASATLWRQEWVDVDGVQAQVLKHGERWSWDARSGDARVERVGPNEDTSPPFAKLLYPEDLVGTAHFDGVRADTQAGRDAYVVHAVPFDDPDSRWEWDDGEEFEISVDAEFGSILRMAAFVDGAAFDIEEVMEIAFNPVISDDIFDFVRPSSPQGSVE